jgi:zinc transporter, ZIP family
MLNAFVFGALAQAPLILGGLIVYWFKVPTRIVGWLAGLGAGALVSAIAYNLITQAERAGPAVVVGGMLIGTGVFVGLDYLVEKRFGEAAGAISIVLGAIIDGVPESVIFWRSAGVRVGH